MKKHIPNFLSAVRILLTGVFAYLVLFRYPDSLPYALAVFVLAGFTDVADGILARRFGWITDLGKILDPVADKLMQCVALLCLYLKDVVPFWILLFFVVKELLLAAGAMLLFQRRRIIGVSRWTGKAAAVIFYISIALIVLFAPQLGIYVNLLCLLPAVSGLIAVLSYIIGYRNAA